MSGRINCDRAGNGRDVHKAANPDACACFVIAMLPHPKTALVSATPRYAALHLPDTEVTMMRVGGGSLSRLLCQATGEGRQAAQRGFGPLCQVFPVP